MRTIAIIGGGFSGTMLAAHLLRRGASAPTRVVLLERSGRFGRGVAYGTRCPSHVLNVPAGRMSAFDDDADHFLRWLRRGDPTAEGGAFVPRMVYGEYLESVLQQAGRDASPGMVLERVGTAAVDVVPRDAGVSVVLADGRRIEACTAVLAVGNFPPANPPVADRSFYSDPRYLSDPWAPGALAKIAGNEPVLLIGTGLTMVDVALELSAKGRGAPIHAISRRGLLPQPHRSPARPHHPDPPVDIARWERTALGMLRAVRREVRRSARHGIDWREVITSLRPVTAELWSSMNEREQRRWLSHVRPFWETHRHRAAPKAAAAIEEMIRAERLRVHAGRIVAFTSGSDGVAVTVRQRGGETAVEVRAAHVINCTGPDTDLARTPDPLLRAMHQRGVIVSDPLGLGLRATPEGAAIDAAGTPSGRIYLLGPLRRPQLWETTAVPELRVQARELAERLAEGMSGEECPVVVETRGAAKRSRKP